MNTNLIRTRRARNATRRTGVVLAVLTVIAGTFAWHVYAGSAAALQEKSGVTVSGINDRGQAVGTVTRGWQGHGFAWQKGSLKRLGPLVEADTINERGEVLGTNVWGQNVLWENGRTRHLGLAYVAALNDHGQVLGNKGYPRGGGWALWTKGKISLLPFSGDQSVAMNDRGEVVGELPDGDVGEWQGGKVTDLGPGYPIAINDRGEILGSVANGDVTVWQNGVATDLGPGTPVAINERGQVIGAREITPRSVHGFLWSNGTTTDLGGGWPTGISNSGQVVGNSIDHNSQYGFVWQKGTRTRLPAPKGHKGRPTSAVAINDHNQIVGDDCDFNCGHNGGPRGFAVLWTLHGRRITTVQIANGHL